MSVKLLAKSVLDSYGHQRVFDLALNLPVRQQQEFVRELENRGCSVQEVAKGVWRVTAPTGKKKS